MRRYPESTEIVVLLFEGHKLDPAAKRPPPGEFTYSRLKIETARRPPKVEIAPRQSGEKRAVGRLRTKLRSGTIVDRRFRSLVECLIHDRSETGARLRLMADRPVPTRFRLVDAINGVVTPAELVWRRGREVGIRLEHGSCSQASLR